MERHDNAVRIERFLDAYTRASADELHDLLAEDVVWRVGGQHRFSGEYRGRQAALEYFGSVGSETGGSLKLEPLEVMANDQHGAAFLRVTGERDGRRLDTVMAEAFSFDREGRINEFWATANDQAAIDRFWG